MTLDALLDRLEDLGASLRFEGRRVYLRNGAALTQEDREMLRDHRAEIRRLVKLRNRPKAKPEAEPEPSATRQRLNRFYWWSAMSAVRDRGLVAGFETRGPARGSHDAPSASARPAGFAGPSRPSAEHSRLTTTRRNDP